MKQDSEVIYIDNSPEETEPKVTDFEDNSWFRRIKTI